MVPLNCFLQISQWYLETPIPSLLASVVASVFMFLITLLAAAVLGTDFLNCGLDVFCLAVSNKEEELDLVDLPGPVSMGTLLDACSPGSELTLIDPSLIPRVLARSLTLDVEESFWSEVPFLSNSTNVDRVLTLTSGKMMEADTQQGRSRSCVR